MKVPPPPPGFVALDRPLPGFARPEVAETVHRELSRHGTLRQASRTWGDPLELSGRGRLVAAVPPGAGGGSDEEPRWVVRPYLRGGFMAPLLGDRHLAVGTPRPWTEARAAAALDAAGVPTVRVLAGVVYPGWPWYRAELVTAFLAGTTDLGALLFGSDRVADPIRRRALLAAAGRIAETLAAAGVLHRDLNAKNLLRASGPSGVGGAEASPGAVSLHVIDLDRARVGPVSESGTRSMSTRLARSLDKFGERVGPPLSPEEWAAFDSSAPR